MHGRYAPSPTGPLHLGNLRTALVSWLQAKLQGGALFLRYDDLDTPRNQPGSIDQIKQDLDWLGLDFHCRIYYQSEHITDYQEAFEKLQQLNMIYPCSCSRKDIQLAASAPDSRFATSRYPGTCRPQNKTGFIDSSKQCAWRFLVTDATTVFEDIVAGEQSQNVFHQTGDFVVQRKDGFFAYQLATVVDDGNLGITDVVRGVDLIDSTARQLALYKALDLTPPRFWHVPLMLDQNGDKLSKRDGANGLAFYQDQGISADSVIGMLASSLGLVSPGSKLAAHELLQSIDLVQLKKALTGCN